MTYSHVMRQLDCLNRPPFLVTDPVTMVHPTAMLHHRISWNALCGALNRVLAGTLGSNGSGLVNALLSLSPVASAEPVKKFKAALFNLEHLKSGTSLGPIDVAAIEHIEQLIFSLPCNLFLGPTNRCDDPGSDMDFLPNDVGLDGSVDECTDLGAIQILREKIFSLLLNINSSPLLSNKNDEDFPPTLGQYTRKLAELWKKVSPDRLGAKSLEQATGFNPLLWSPGTGVGVALTSPGLRHWHGADPPATCIDLLRLNGRVMTRVKSIKA